LRDRTRSFYYKSTTRLQRRQIVAAPVVDRKEGTLQELANRDLDLAQTRGASYVDIRVPRTQTQITMVKSDIEEAIGGILAPALKFGGVQFANATGVGQYTPSSRRRSSEMPK
jgi:hypothetical protein